MSDAPLPALPPRPDDAHKGGFGTVVVVGGSAGMLGAPCFAALAALRIGTGIVRIAAPSEVLDHCLALVPSAMGVALPDAVDGSLLDEFTPGAVLAIGPGLGTRLSRARLLAAAARSAHPLVVDADGLGQLARLAPHEWTARRVPLVLTPHLGEYDRLALAWDLPRLPAGADAAARRAAASALAQRARATVVLKGAETVVAEEGRAWMGGGANPALAIPGSGDVLTGMVAGLLAQGADGWDAARLGVHLHALAGGLWRDAHGARGLLAMELAGMIPAACARHPAG